MGKKNRGKSSNNNRSTGDGMNTKASGSQDNGKSSENTQNTKTASSEKTEEKKDVEAKADEKKDAVKFDFSKMSAEEMMKAAYENVQADEKEIMTETYKEILYKRQSPKMAMTKTIAKWTGIVTVSALALWKVVELGIGLFSKSKK